MTTGDLALTIIVVAAVLWLAYKFITHDPLDKHWR